MYNDQTSWLPNARKDGLDRIDMQVAGLTMTTIYKVPSALYPETMILPNNRQLRNDEIVYRVQNEAVDSPARTQFWMRIRKNYGVYCSTPSGDVPEYNIFLVADGAAIGSQEISLVKTIPNENQQKYPVSADEVERLIKALLVHLGYTGGTINALRPNVHNNLELDITNITAEPKGQIPSTYPVGRTALKETTSDGRTITGYSESKIEPAGSGALSPTNQRIEHSVIFTDGASGSEQGHVSLLLQQVEGNPEAQITIYDQDVGGDPTDLTVVQVTEDGVLLWAQGDLGNDTEPNSLMVSGREGLKYNNQSLTDPIVALMRFNYMVRTETDDGGRVRLFDFAGKGVSWNDIAPASAGHGVEWVDEGHTYHSASIGYRAPNGSYVFLLNHSNQVIKEVPSIIAINRS